MISKINTDALDLGANNLDKLLGFVLKDTFIINPNVFRDNIYKKHIFELLEAFSEFDEKGKVEDVEIIRRFRSAVYEQGSAFELLIIDALLAVFLLKLNYSGMWLLPQYTDLAPKEWEKAILDGNLIKELWPSQRKIGEFGVYKGKSSVIQMPTSSGKTKAISLMIYSAFISNRSDFAVIVAPYRALCREISNDLKNDFQFDPTIRVDELSDILIIEKLLICGKAKTCLVLTPEKLLYLIRQRPELIEKIGIIVFDEAHLFDDLSRGATYELLVSTIKVKASEDMQKVFISAIVPNSKQVNDWINGEGGVVIADNTIKSTERTIAISDWRTYDNKRSVYLHFLNPENPEEEEFFVPRTIRFSKVAKLPREQKERLFPEIDANGNVVSNDIAIYYALKQCDIGATVIFCGTKISANSILKRILKLKERNYDIGNIILNANLDEISKICNLILANYGKDNEFYIAGQVGAFAHHAGISQGIKVSLEYAMSKGLICFLACTSTLAQGVNLPIKYLIISSIYQAREQIRTRDFHNLIGRAGRSGIYTEGSVILTEMDVYNNKNAFNNWKWKQYRNLINVENSEECSSVILDLIRAVKLSWRETFNFKEPIMLYYTDREEFKRKFGETENNEILSRFDSIFITLNAIESFLMSCLVEDEYSNYNDVLDILDNTYAVYLATDEEKVALKELFVLICDYIISNTEDTEKRQRYSRSLQSIEKNLIIEAWVVKNSLELAKCLNTIDLFQLVAPLLFLLSEGKALRKITEESAFIQIGTDWIKGISYFEMHSHADSEGTKVIYRKKPKDIDIKDIIDICDRGISYSTTLIISAIIEIYSASDGSAESIVELLKDLSKQLRYGLPSITSIALYELGFCDRCVCQLISETLQIDALKLSKDEVKKILNQERIKIADVIDGYPSIFMNRLKEL